MKKMANYFIVLLAWFPVTIFAAATDWKIIPERSQLNFIAYQNGAPVSGRFEKFSGQIHFDPDQLAASKVKIIVDINSIATDYEDLTTTLETADWFNMKVFPEAVFESSAFTKIGDKQFQAKGTLKIRDQSQPLTLTFIFEQPTADTALARGTTVLKRTAFGVGQGEWSSVNEVQDDVKVNFKVNAVKNTPSPQRSSPPQS